MTNRTEFTPAAIRLLPLGSKALLAVLVGSFLAVLFLGLLRVWDMREDRLAALADQVQRTAEYAARTLARPMYDYDYDLVANQIEGLKDDPDIVAVMVEDGDGVQVGFFGTGAPVDMALVVDRPLIHDARGEPAHVGRLRVFYSRAAVDAAVNRAIIEGSAILFGVFFFLSVFIIVTFRSLTYPISGIGTVMLQLAQGETVDEIPGLDRTDELGEMARSLDVFRRHAEEIVRLQEEKAAEQVVRESEQQLRQMIESMPVMIVVLSRHDGTVIYANQLMRHAVLGPEIDPMGIPAALFLEGEEQRLFEVAAMHDSIDREVRFRCFDGKQFWGMVSGRPLSIGGADVLLLGISDVTDRRRASDALIAAKEEAESATRIKSEFLATMSHEIRTPMNGIVGMTDLMLDTAMTDEQRRMGETIRASAESLLTIINDILDYSKMEAGHFDINAQPFELRSLVEGAVDIVGPRLKGKDVDLIYTITADADSVFNGDAVRIRQVMLNLLGNAVKFTEHGSVKVSATLEEGHIRIAIQDTGIGIPKEAQGKLFEKFIQADSSTSRRFGGTGLGLAISRRLVEAMGGDIGFSSEDGKGSTFWFTLPLEWIEARTAPPPALEGWRVLVVDDSDNSAGLLVQELTEQGATVERSATAPAAMEAARGAVAAGTPFDGLVVDHDMPMITGADLLVMLKADPAFAVTRCVLMAPGNDAVVKAMTERLVNVAVVHKPAHARHVAVELAQVGAAKDVSAPVAAAAAGRSLNILLVEDNPINQQVAMGILAALGHKVEVASDAADGVAMVCRGEYDVVLMDVQLPDMDGYQATGLIRSLDGDKARIPIVAMTANAMEGDRERCLAAGMDDYLSKPIRRPALVQALARWGGD